MQKMLPTIDLTVLTNVVRQNQRSTAFEVLDWTVSTLSNRSTVNPDGVLRVSGQGRDSAGVRPWSVALKIIMKPEAEGEPNHLGYWMREVYAYDSGLLTSLPGPVVPARYYGTTMHPDSAWIWMELLTDAPAANGICGIMLSPPISLGASMARACSAARCRTLPG
jgi:hypothetical protein